MTDFGTDPEARPAADSESAGLTQHSAGEHEADAGFRVRLENFEGPFDLLLQLISQHELDVTEVALHRVTDDFIAYTRALGDQWNLDETTEFLVVAATLLDLKAARLLPSGDVEDEQDLALLEARDLLFARVLQYRAYKQVAELFAEMEAGALRRYPRSVALEERYLGLLPEMMLGVGPDRFAEIAAEVFRPKPPQVVATEHMRAGRVSVTEHADVLRIRLAELGAAGFGELVGDCGHTLEIVARFLALLELYREGSVTFEQDDPLGALRVRWDGGSVDEVRADCGEQGRSAVDEEYG